MLFSLQTGAVITVSVYLLNCYVSNVSVVLTADRQVRDHCVSVFTELLCEQR